MSSVNEYLVSKSPLKNNFISFFSKSRTEIKGLSMYTRVPEGNLSLLELYVEKILRISSQNIIKNQQKQQTTKN